MPDEYVYRVKYRVTGVPVEELPMSRRRLGKLLAFYSNYPGEIIAVERAKPMRWTDVTVDFFPDRQADS